MLFKVCRKCHKVLLIYFMNFLESDDIQQHKQSKVQKQSIILYILRYERLGARLHG